MLANSAHTWQSARVPHVTCEIVRWTDDPQPGWVEARLTDVNGALWTFEDKAPVFTALPLTSATSYPVPGIIRCEIVEEDGPQGRTVIDTSRPDGVAATDGITTQFTVRSIVVNP